MQVVVLWLMVEVFALNNNVKYRIRFSKTDKMQYIGHLDLLTFFQRAIKRARLPIAYSQGFNPHQLTSFAIPLPLGMTSVCEYVEIQLKELVSCEEVKEKLNLASTKGIEILDVRIVGQEEKGCAAEVCAATYEIHLDTYIDNFELRYNEILDDEQWNMEKKGKKATKIVDIKPDVYSLEILNNKDKTVIRTCIATGSGNNLKPELLLSYIYSRLNMEFNPFRTEIVRLELLRQGKNGLELL